MVGQSDRRYEIEPSEKGSIGIEDPADVFHFVFPVSYVLPDSP